MFCERGASPYLQNAANIPDTSCPCCPPTPALPPNFLMVAKEWKLGWDHLCKMGLAERCLALSCSFWLYGSGCLPLVSPLGMMLGHLLLQKTSCINSSWVRSVLG